MMARLPIDPRISRMIIEAEKEGCVDDILIVAAALSIQDPRERPVEFEKEADSIHAGFSDPSSDFLTLIRIWERYHDFLKTAKSKNKVKKFCREHYLSFRRMREWIDVHDQLKEILDEQGWDIKDNKDMNDKIHYDAIHKSILSGYLSNIATKKEKNIYTAAKGKEVMIFPGSGLFNKGGSWIVAADIIETSRHFARTAAVIKVEWLEKLAGNLCRSTYSEPHWSKDRGEVVAFEQVSLFGLMIVPRRLVSYGRINPDEASEIFIRSALVEGNMKNPIPFLMHNHTVIERVVQMENKIRKRNLLADEEGIAGFYRQRLSNISDLRTLQKMIREKGSDSFLRMTEEDIMQKKPDDELFLFPDEVAIDKHRFPCTYAYEPGNSNDGITLKIPIHMVSTLTASYVDWMIPGLLKDKIIALLKGLPKEYKKQLPHLAHTCAIIVSEIKIVEGSLVSALSKFINEKFGVDIPAAIWVPDGLAEYLRIRFSVVDSKGQEVASSRDIGKLQHDIMKEAESQAFNKARKQWEKTGLTSWNFGDLPDAIPLESGGYFEGYAYPGLEAGDGCVHVRLFRNKQDADKSHINGIAALYKIYFRDELKYLKKALSLSGDARRFAETFCGAKKFENAIFEKVIHDLFCKNIRMQDDFLSHTEHVVQSILPTGQTILNRCIPYLRAYCDCTTVFKNSEKTNRANGPARQYLSIMKMELDNLMPVDFLIRYNNERLTHIMRYIKALSIRAERGIVHLEKAFSRTEDVKIYSDKYIDMINSISAGTSEDKIKAIEDYRWMIEEYKVSVFAQELKTAFPISQKRLEMKIQEIERMI
jgi:ATP-dependent helicase HrpA